jgi:hypothetical protein
MKALFSVGVVGLLVLGVQVDPSRAQFAPITFPDTAVGSSATVKCPDTTVSICFGGPSCSGSGTVQSVSGPSAPFSVGKFSVLSNAEFFGGNCEAHPVSLPVTLASGQIFAYQATFAPTSAGSFNGTVTFNTPGGPATINLVGNGTGSGTSSPGLGLVTLTATPERAVPGNRVEIGYAIARESLTGPVDLYVAVMLPPTGQLLFISETGEVTPSLVPFRRNLPPADTAATLFQGFPVDVPFGTYTFLMALMQAGKPAAVETLASPVANATLTFAPLSAAQQAMLQQRGNPDSYTMFWIDETHEKREVWLYRSAPAVTMVFVNGALDSTTPLSTPGGGSLKVDPGLFTPQTSRAQLIEKFGPPTSQSPTEGFDLLSFAGGLGVIFTNNRLISVSTETP